MRELPTSNPQNLGDGTVRCSWRGNRCIAPRYYLRYVTPRASPFIRALRRPGGRRYGGGLAKNVCGGSLMKGTVERIQRPAFLDDFNVGLGRRQRNVPRIVAIQPTCVLVTAFHPSVGARDSLNARRAGLSVRFVAQEGSLDVVAFDFLQTARQDRGILDRGRPSLRHVRCHRMAGVTQQHHASIAPARQGLALEDGPLVAIRARFYHGASVRVETFVRLAQLFHVTLG